jgi:DNA polymerase/3'-5' exonuclease PolX
VSGAGGRRPLAAAEAIAAELVGMLRECCARIDVAGSVRRRAAEVGDVELLAEPLVLVQSVGLFDEPSPTDQLAARCELLRVRGDIARELDGRRRPAWGPRHKRFAYRGLGVDLFVVKAPAEYGVLLALRTGPALFSRRLVTVRQAGGFLPSWFVVHDGALWYRGRDDDQHPERRISTPTEQAFFAALGLRWLPPSERTGTETHDELAAPHPQAGTRYPGEDTRATAREGGVPWRAD